MTMIAMNTSVQITASQLGRMFVAPCAAELIDMPAIDVEWPPPWLMLMPLMLPMTSRRYHREIGAMSGRLAPAPALHARFCNGRVAESVAGLVFACDEQPSLRARPAYPRAPRLAHGARLRARGTRRARVGRSDRPAAERRLDDAPGARAGGDDAHAPVSRR